MEQVAIATTQHIAASISKAATKHLVRCMGIMMEQQEMALMHIYRAQMQYKPNITLPLKPILVRTALAILCNEIHSYVNPPMPLSQEIIIVPSEHNHVTRQKLHCCALQNRH